MKRFLTLVLLMMVLLIAAPARGGGDSEAELLRHVGSAVNWPLTAGTVVSHEDTHGGFHGDGETFVEIEIDGLEGELEYAVGWKRLPMSENAAQCVRLTTLAKEVFPDIEEGFYYFCDCHSQSRDHYDDSEVHSRASWNFAVAAYDSGTGRLYYYQLDT